MLTFHCKTFTDKLCLYPQEIHNPGLHAGQGAYLEKKKEEEVHTPADITQLPHDI